MTMRYPHEKVYLEPTPNAAYIYDQEVKNMDEVKLHQDAVKQLMNIIGCEIRCRATYHDYTKLKHEHLTFEEHMTTERHHLNNPKGVPDDVNVIDLVEFICDVVSAAAQRTGTLDFRLTQVDESLLRQIINNTIMDLWKLVRVNKEDDKDG